MRADLPPSGDAGWRKSIGIRRPFDLSKISTRTRHGYSADDPQACAPDGNQTRAAHDKQAITHLRTVMTSLRPMTRSIRAVTAALLFATLLLSGCGHKITESPQQRAQQMQQMQQSLQNSKVPPMARAGIQQQYNQSQHSSN